MVEELSIRREGTKFTTSYYSENKLIGLLLIALSNREVDFARDRFD